MERLQALLWVQLPVPAVDFSKVPLLLENRATISLMVFGSPVVMLSGRMALTISTKFPDIAMIMRRATGSSTRAMPHTNFFGVQVYFNFFYALRALTTAILIIMAPMMVAMITISSSRKQTTMTWAKELLANILVQPIHTFCITVILLLPASSHGFDNLIALYAIIPFTSMVLYAEEQALSNNAAKGSVATGESGNHFADGLWVSCSYADSGSLVYG